LPEQLVELSDREARQLSELPRERRFAGRSATEEGNALHGGSIQCYERGGTVSAA
jgi:hypothetical protein